ncbi:MAG: cupin domain-containing protein [Pseudomonadota bacterium]
MSDVVNAISNLRRVVTENDPNGKSQIMIDEGPAEIFRSGEVGGLYEIWHDAAQGPLAGLRSDDLAKGTPQLSPGAGKVKIRWFAIEPAPEGASLEDLTALTRQAFIDMGAGDHQPDTRKHPAMHLTHTLDAIILVKGRVRLILDQEDTEIGPGDVVVQRATNHAWAVIGDAPALFVAVLVDRSAG